MDEGKHTSKKTCPLCNSNESILFIEDHDRSVAVPDTIYRLVQCCSCSLIYMRPMPEVSDIAKFYPEQYWWDVDLSRLFDRFFTRLRRMLWWDIVTLIKGFAPRRGSLLDVGCGGGIFLYAASRAGFQVTGIDQSRKSCQMIREQFGIEAGAGWIENIEEKKSFDVITLFHVLEHLTDPVSVLQKLHNRLNGDGHLVIEVPNIESLGFRITGKRWTGLDLPRHLTHFSPVTIKNLLAKSGFTIIKQNYFTLRNAPAILSNSISCSLLGKIKSGIKTKPVTNSLKLILRIMLYVLFMPLAYFESLAKKGEVILVIARKVEASGNHET